MGINKCTFSFLFHNGYTLNIQDNLQRSFLISAAQVINPLVGFHTTYLELLNYTYYFPKELNMSVEDVNMLTYEWAQLIYEKLQKDKEDEAKRQEEENAKQEEEYKKQQQMMSSQYNFGNMMSGMPNFMMNT